jgi:hypothetical protein
MHTPLGDQRCSRCGLWVKPRRRILPRYCPRCGTALPAATPPPPPAVADEWPSDPDELCSSEAATERRHSGKAVAALALATLSLMVSVLPGPGLILALIAIGLARSAGHSIAESGGRLTGDSTADAATALAGISLMITFLVWGGCVVCIL